MSTTSLDDLMQEQPVEAVKGMGPAFQTKKFALQALLDKASNVVPSRDTLPVLKNFLVVVGQNSVQVAATDLVLSVLATSQMVQVQRAGTCVLPAARIRDIVKEAEDGDLTLDVKDGAAHISCGPTKWKIKIMSGDEYPDLPDAASLTYESIDRSKFLQALRAVKYAASVDASRPSLMLVDVKDGLMRASDGVRFQESHIGDKIKLDFQIPISAVDDLVKILGTTEAQKIEIGEDDDSLVFKIGSDVFISQKVTAIFPNLEEQLIKPALGNEWDLHVDKDDLASAIKRVRITADPETSAFVMDITKGAVEVSAKDKFGSSAVERVEAVWDAQDVTLAFNHEHFLQMLSASDAKSCFFKVGKGTKTRPAPILLVEGEGGLAILNQIRLDFVS